MRALPLRLLLVGGISAAAMATPAPAFAQHHKAHVAATGGVRFNSRGRLADEYPWGMLLGVEAGYEPFARIGLQWKMLFGYYPSSSAQSVNDWLAMTDMGFAIALRVLEANAWSVVLSPGVNIVRADGPVPPTDERTFFGPSVGFTFQYAESEFFFSGGLTYGLINDDPTGLTFLISVGVGSR